MLRTRCETNYQMDRGGREEQHIITSLVFHDDGLSLVVRDMLVSCKAHVLREFKVAPRIKFKTHSSLTETISVEDFLCEASRQRIVEMLYFFTNLILGKGEWNNDQRSNRKNRKQRRPYI